MEPIRNLNHESITEFVYSSKEVCKMLDIASSTLRSWCLKLEDRGYEFKRENSELKNSPRIFYKHDIETLRALQKLLDQGLQFDSALTQVLGNEEGLTGVVAVDSTSEGLEILTSSGRYIVPEEVKTALMHQFQESMRQTIREEMEEALKNRDKQIEELKELLLNQKKWWQFWK